MNIEGNEVIWEKNNTAITSRRSKFVVYKHITSQNEDGTAFRFWSSIESFDDLNTAIAFAKEL